TAGSTSAPAASTTSTNCSVSLRKRPKPGPVYNPAFHGARRGPRERERVVLAAASELKITSETLVLLCSQLKRVTFTLQELATMSNGKLLGDPARQITGAASLVEAIDGEVSFFNNPKYVALLRKTRASAVFVP